MEINNDPKIAVIDKDVLEGLVWLAKVGENEIASGDYNKYLKHIRRFNPHLRPSLKSDQERLIEEIKKDKERLREILRTKVDQEVYLDLSYNDKVLYPVILKGKSSNDFSLLFDDFLENKVREYLWRKVIYDRPPYVLFKRDYRQQQLLNFKHVYIVYETQKELLKAIGNFIYQKDQVLTYIGLTQEELDEKVRLKEIEHYYIEDNYYLTEAAIVNLKPPRTMEDINALAAITWKEIKE